MSLDVTLIDIRPVSIYERNITHNLNRMAMEAGIYYHLWRPEEMGITKAGELIEPLSEALSDMIANPAKFEKYNPENGWGRYEDLLDFIADYLVACKATPNATIEVSR